MKYMILIAVFALGGCTTLEIKDISNRLAVAEAEIQMLKALSHHPLGVTK